MSRDAAPSRGPRLATAAGVAVLLALAVVAATAFERGMATGRGTRAGSSFRADETGTLAARLLLERLGHSVSSRRGARLPRGTGHVLVRLEGVQAGSEVGEGIDAALDQRVPASELQAEWNDLHEWVARGNGLLLLASRSPPDPWPRIDTDDGRNERVFFNGAAVPFTPAAELAESAVEDLGAPLVSGRSEIEPDGIDEGDEVLATLAGGEVVIVERAVGKGRLVVVADPYFASNVRLGSRGDNAAWLAVLVERLDGDGDGDVYFDDRAVGQAASRGVLSLLIERGFGPALGAGFVLLLLVWWRLGPSDAPDRRVRDDAVYAPESFAALRAGLYAHCLDADDVRRTVRAEVVRRIARGDGIGYDRALDLLAARDPAAARTIRDAVAALPDHSDVTVRRYPRLWADGVAAVWQSLESVRHGRQRASTGG